MNENQSKLGKNKLAEIQQNIVDDLVGGKMNNIRKHASSANKAEREFVCSTLKRLYKDMKPYFKDKILQTLNILASDKDEKVREVATFVLKKIIQTEFN